MASKQEVELFISEDGQVKVHIKGIKGPGCVNVLSGLSGKIGIEKERALTAEYYASEVNASTKARVKENQR
mgnify:CR=1 FL=1